MNRRILRIAVAIAGVIAPTSVFAQNGGLVTVAPLGAPAPVVGVPFLGLLAVLLAGLGVAVLRRSRSSETLLLVSIAFVLTASVAYSTNSNLIVSGVECHAITQKGYDSFMHLDLESKCPNQIRIIDLELHCDTDPDETLTEPPPSPRCEIGLILAPGETCLLPACFC